MKQCCACKNKKELSEFGKDASKKDGLASMCSACKRMVEKDRYLNDWGKRKAYCLNIHKQMRIENKQKLIE
jgi:hypothetical protein